MPKYLMLFRGTPPDMASMTEEMVAEEMGYWRDWMAKMGPALVEAGAPFGPTSSVVDDGSAGTPTDATGYSIIEAGDPAAAEAIAREHPYMRERKGNYAIDLLELMPIPMYG